MGLGGRLCLDDKRGHTETKSTGDEKANNAASHGSFPRVFSMVHLTIWQLHVTVGRRHLSPEAERNVLIPRGPPRGIQRGGTEPLHHRDGRALRDGDCSMRGSPRRRPSGLRTGGLEAGRPQGPSGPSRNSGARKGAPSHAARGRGGQGTPRSPGAMRTTGHPLRVAHPTQDDASKRGGSGDAVARRGWREGRPRGRTRSLAPQGGHGVRSIPVPSCRHCPHALRAACRGRAADLAGPDSDAGSAPWGGGRESPTAAATCKTA